MNNSVRCMRRFRRNIWCKIVMPELIRLKTFKNLESKYQYLTCTD